MIGIMCLHDIDTIELWELLRGEVPDLREFYTKDNKWCWVYKVKRNIAGYVFYTVRKNSLHIASLHVIPEYRTLPVAEELLEHAVNKVDSSVPVFISQSNLEAQNLLKSMGFKAIASINNNYKFVSMKVQVQ